MINKKWIAAGYAAALISIILVVTLLGIAFHMDHSSNVSREEADMEQGASHSGGSSADTSEGDGSEAEEKDPEGSPAEEKDGMPAADSDSEEAKAEILALSGNELWSRFDGAVLTGDSRVVGFSLYTSIPDSNVLAENGATIAALSGFIPQIAALKPQRVYIAYGINDIKSAVGGKTAESYSRYAEEKIGELEEALDGAEIFVNSILPVSPFLEEKDRDYQKVADYNTALRKMCLRRGWHYIDNSGIAVKYADQYVGDGIHLQAGFYEHWGRNMLLAEAGVRYDEGGTGVDR